MKDLFHHGAIKPRPLLHYLESISTRIEIPGGNVSMEISTPCDKNLRESKQHQGILNHLEWEIHKTRCSKMQLIELFKMIHCLIDIRSSDSLTTASSRTENPFHINIYSIPHPLTASRTAFPQDKNSLEHTTSNSS